MKRKYDFLLWALFFCLPLLNSCSQETQRSIHLMTEIQDGLRKAYEHNNIILNMGLNKNLKITFINSKFNNLKQEVREKESKKIAKYAFSIIGNKMKVGNILVGFTLHNSISPISITKSLSVHSFNLTDFQEEGNSPPIMTPTP